MYIYKNIPNNKDIIQKHKPCEISVFSVYTLINQKIILQSQIMETIPKCTILGEDAFFFFLIFEFNLIYFFIQQVLISYQFYTYCCIYVNPNLPIHPTTTTPPPSTFPPWCPYVCSLHLCLYFCPANWFIWTIFLGSTYMR